MIDAPASVTAMSRPICAKCLRRIRAFIVTAEPDAVKFEIECCGYQMIRLMDYEQIPVKDYERFAKSRLRLALDLSDEPRVWRRVYFVGQQVRIRGVAISGFEHDWYDVIDVEDERSITVSREVKHVRLLGALPGDNRAYTIARGDVIDVRVQPPPSHHPGDNIRRQTEWGKREHIVAERARGDWVATLTLTLVKACVLRNCGATIDYDQLEFWISDVWYLGQSERIAERDRLRRIDYETALGRMVAAHRSSFAMNMPIFYEPDDFEKRLLAACWSQEDWDGALDHIGIARHEFTDGAATPSLEWKIRLDKSFVAKICARWNP